MKITIKCDTDDKNLEMVFDDSGLDNHNFVEFTIQDTTYCVLIEDLFRVAEVFEKIRKEKE